MRCDRRILRRARANRDGPFSHSALIAGQKVPLSADQIEELCRQALDLAAEPPEGINTVLT